jgi:hypothetical protein
VCNKNLKALKVGVDQRTSSVSRNSKSARLDGGCIGHSGSSGLSRTRSIRWTSRLISSCEFPVSVGKVVHLLLVGSKASTCSGLLIRQIEGFGEQGRVFSFRCCLSGKGCRKLGRSKSFGLCFADGVQISAKQARFEDESEFGVVVQSPNPVNKWRLDVEL